MRDIEPNESLPPLLSAELRSLLRWADRVDNDSAWAHWRNLECIMGPLLVSGAPESFAGQPQLSQEIPPPLPPRTVREVEKNASVAMPSTRLVS
ncbi:MAG: hypothetical protein HQL63_04640 [Magnetococcales bacterium]|nr:hypothetical protein [Magnetococcales bacterium]MBF0323181.1 hypothetical protein [Magnetococcales bacterium]